MNIPITQEPPTENHLKKLETQGCDLLISAGYTFKIPNWRKYNIKYGINIHPSILPEGAGPMPHTILKGLYQTGVTLHKLTQVNIFNVDFLKMHRLWKVLT